MDRKTQILLAADSAINLVLGILLLFFPTGILEFMGLPKTDTYFYTSLLGAVIFGIGIALMLELRYRQSPIQGLGLAGAIAINLCGGLTLMAWLVFGKLDLPLRGHITLWIVALVVVGIGLVELLSGAWKQAGD